MGCLLMIPLRAWGTMALHLLKSIFVHSLLSQHLWQEEERDLAMSLSSSLPGFCVSRQAQIRPCGCPLTSPDKGVGAPLLLLGGPHCSRTRCSWGHAANRALHVLACSCQRPREH